MSPSPTGNLLLDAIPETERARILERARRVHLKLGDVLYEQGEEVQDVHFLTSGGASVLIMLKNGEGLEPGIVGREGVLGFPMGLGDNRSRWRSVIQVEGDAYVVSVDDMTEFLRNPGELGPLLMHYSGLLVTFVAQSAACTRFHDIRQRAARWLLHMHDRADDDQFPITHEWLAHMLGSSRPALTVEVGALSNAGLIGLHRGAIQVVNRAGLERASCECYAKVQDAFDELVQAPDGEAEQDGYRPTEKDGEGSTASNGRQ